MKDAAAEASVRKRVLVVDDQEDLAEWIADELHRLGCVVDIAYDGPMALELVETFQPDFILLDIAMPGMNGWEVARRVRRLPTDTPPRLIAISAMRDDAHAARSLAAGFEAHLTKPLRLHDLAALLQSQRPPGSH